MERNQKLHSVLKPLSFDIEEDSALTEPQLKKYLKFYSIDFGKRPDVVHRMGKFSAAGFSIATHYWTLEDARGTVFVIHGYLDHVGLYGHIIQWCLKEHYNVVAFDLPGHGFSTGEQASIENFDQYGEVLKTLVSLCNDQLLKPYYCIAQCLGAATVMNMLWKHKKHPFAKMVFLSPLVRSKLWDVGKLKYFLLGSFLKSTSRGFVANSSNKQFLRFVSTKDPLQSKRIPFKWIMAMRRWAREYSSMPTEIIKPLVLQGDQDDSVEWKRNMKQVKEHFPKAEIVYLKGANHHLANESKSVRTVLFSKLKNYLDVSYNLQQ